MVFIPPSLPHSQTENEDGIFHKLTRWRGDPQRDICGFDPQQQQAFKWSKYSLPASAAAAAAAQTDPHPAYQPSIMTTKRSLPSQAACSKLDILAQNEIKLWSAVDVAVGVCRVTGSSSETANN